jgi:hypothetical protein
MLNVSHRIRRSDRSARIWLPLAKLVFALCRSPVRGDEPASLAVARLRRAFPPVGRRSLRFKSAPIGYRFATRDFPKGNRDVKEKAAPKGRLFL